MTASTVRVGVIGLGFMGRTHLGAYAAANLAGESNRLVAVCDRDAARRGGDLQSSGNLATEAGGFDPAQVAGYAEPAELLADERIDLVSICTHTPTHVPLAIAALEADKHVLVEKPVAVCSAEAQRLVDAAAASDRICMPAMCVRYWPGWDVLLAALRDHRYGPLESLILRRLGTRPDWSGGFYEDAGASGGALFDMHVHDADLVLTALGKPSRVHSAGTRDHVLTRYEYGADGPLVVAEGGWDHHPGFPFRMSFTAVFERATLDHDLQRDPPLLLASEGGRTEPALAAGDGYHAEVRALLRAVRTGDRADLPSAAEALAVTRLIECEARSLDTGAAVDV